MMAESCPDLVACSAPPGGGGALEGRKGGGGGALEKQDSAISLSADDDARMTDRLRTYYDVDVGDDVTTNKVCCVLCRKKEVAKDSQTDSSYQSYTDVSSVASSAAATDAGLGGIRESDARPITNPKLREKLEMAGMNGTVKLRQRRSSAFNSRHSMPIIKPADQKILELMMAKQEEQREQQRRRDAAHRKWELERASSTRDLSETSRRRSVHSAEQRRAWEQRRSQIEKRERPQSIDHSHLSQCTHRQASSPAAPSARRASSIESPHHRSRDECMECLHGSSASLAQRQVDLNRLAEEKALRDLQKKRAQESRLQARRKEQDDHHTRLKEEQERVLRRAQSAKDVRDQEHALKIKMRNFQTKQRQEEKLSKVRQQSTENLSQRRLISESRLERASMNRHEKESNKDHELQKNHHSYENRLAHSRLLKQKQDNSLKKYQDEITAYRHEQEEQAELLAKEAIEAKRRRTLSDQQQRQQLQRVNMQKLMENEEVWKADVEASIAMKDSRLKVLQMEKDEKIAKSRAVAHTSQLLREQLKSHYSMTDLDDLNRQAEAESKIRTSRLTSAGGVASQMSRLSLCLD